MCPECLKVDREQFTAVREHLKRNPGADIAAVSEATGVSIKRIQEYLREGRLVLAKSVEWLKCERCGEPLSTGRLCATCAQEMQRGIGARAGDVRPRELRPSEPVFEPREIAGHRGTGKKVVRDKFRRR